VRRRFKVRRLGKVKRQLSGAIPNPQSVFSLHVRLARTSAVAACAPAFGTRREVMGRDRTRIDNAPMVDRG
jgi:hypothetical protein